MNDRIYRGRYGTYRVVGNNLLAKMCERPKKKGALFVPDTAFLPHAVGEVLAVGTLTGKKARSDTTIPGIKPGDYVVFLRLLERTDTNPQLNRIEEGIVRLRPDDVLLVLDEQDLERVQ